MSNPAAERADNLPQLIAVDRAANELRRGRPVVVRDGAAFVALAAAEAVDEAGLGALKRLGRAFLGLTLLRANILRVRTAVTDPVLIALSERMTAPVIRGMADPTTDLEHPLLGPFTAETLLPPGAAAAVTLCKRARLLPAAILVPLAPPQARTWMAAESVLSVAAAAITDFEVAAARSLRPVVAAHVPLADAENTRVIAFRPGDGAIEHLAIVIGDPGRAEPVLTRLHSECFTGDLLGSLRCDCGEQLRGAIATIRQAGAGVLLYLAQEGRGIGLINKLRAYRLQDQGFDTIDANQRLGFEADERLFLPAAEMLRQLGFDRIRLMTNNPDKVAGLERCGITVTERVPHAFPANNHNEAYLATKKKRSGHYL